MAEECCPNAIICLDAFHVVSWATEALDEVRREVWNAARRAGMEGDAKALKDARWALWKNPGKERADHIVQPGLAVCHRLLPPDFGHPAKALSYELGREAEGEVEPENQRGVPLSPPFKPDKEPREVPAVLKDHQIVPDDPGKPDSPPTASPGRPTNRPRWPPARPRSDFLASRRSRVQDSRASNHCPAIASGPLISIDRVQPHFISTDPS